MDTESCEPQAPTVTIKAKIDVVTEILEALTPTQVEIFKKTCFGHWLDVGVKKNNQLLIHTLLTCMFDGKPSELSFDVQGKRIHFRPQEFCLVTGLRFGPNMNIKKWVQDTTDNPFRTRIFPDIEPEVTVKLFNVLKIFDALREKSLVLEDNDAVRICLLVLLEHGFLGRQSTHKVSNEMLKLVEDISNGWNIFPWGSYVWDYTFPQLRHALGKRKEYHEEKHARGEKIQYTMTGFVWAFMIWILEAVPATHRFVRKSPIPKIPRAMAWQSNVSFSWARCCSLFNGKESAPPLETLKPTKAERESDWWKASFEFFEGKDVLNEKKRKRDTQPLALQAAPVQPTYDQLMTTVTTLTQTVATLTQTVSSLQGTIGPLESRINALEGDARVSTLTQTVSQLESSNRTLESRLVEGDARVSTLTKTVSQLESTIRTLESRSVAVEDYEIGVASDGDIAYTTPGLSNTSHGPLRVSPATTVPPSLPLANRRNLRDVHTPAKLKSPMKLYLRKGRKKLVKNTKETHVVKGDGNDTQLDVKRKEVVNVSSQNTTKKTKHTEVDLEFIRTEQREKPTYDLPYLTKIKRKSHYPVFLNFLKKVTNIYLDCLPKQVTCEPWFWEALYPRDDLVPCRDQGKLENLHINAYIEVLMRKRPSNANWTLGLCDLVAFHKQEGEVMSMVSVVDAVRATIDGTNPKYPAWDQISQVFFPINLRNDHWVVVSWNLENYRLQVYDSLETKYETVLELLTFWKGFIQKDLEKMDYFKKTERDPQCFKFSFFYMKDKGVPQQSFKYGTQDCGVMACKFIRMLTKGQEINMKFFCKEVKNFDVAEVCRDFRCDMALELYATRCEKPM